MTTNDSMAINDENIIEIVRPINMLLNLASYQGMSDVEIDSIIEYKEQLAYSKGCSDTKIEISESNRNEISEIVKANLDKSNEILEQITNTIPQFITIGD